MNRITDAMDLSRDGGGITSPPARDDDNARPGVPGWWRIVVLPASWGILFAITYVVVVSIVRRAVAAPADDLAVLRAMEDVYRLALGVATIVAVGVGVLVLRLAGERWLTGLLAAALVLGAFGIRPDATFDVIGEASLVAALVLVALLITRSAEGRSVQRHGTGWLVLAGTICIAVVVLAVSRPYESLLTGFVSAVGESMVGGA